MDEAHQRRGLGTRLVVEMLAKMREKIRTVNFFAITRPTVLWTDKLKGDLEGIPESDRQRLLQPYEDIAVTYFRSLGFRQIGSSGWFALASDPEHPSRSLSISDDYHPVVLHRDGSEYPQSLMLAMEGSDQSQCIEKLRKFFDQIPVTDSFWLIPDEDGNTILHIAALKKQPKTVDSILNYGFGQKMLATRNDAGDTPLEALLIRLEKERTFAEINGIALPMSDHFEGHGESAVLCLASLKDWKNATQLQLARLDFGCTCGQCIKGFLSPRMAYALECRANFIRCEIGDEFSPDAGPEWVECCSHMLEYVPVRVRENFKTSKSMRQGFVSMFDHIAACLEAKKLPTKRNVLRAWNESGESKPVSRNFLQGGGSVESVARTCFQLAMDEDYLAGDRHHWDVCYPDIEELPACRNDHEFAFVSGMCGYRRISHIRDASFYDEVI